MSEGRALTNCIGNGVATMVIAKWQGERDEERFQAVLDDPSLADPDVRRRGRRAGRPSADGGRFERPEPSSGAGLKRRALCAFTGARRCSEAAPARGAALRALRPHGAVVDSVNVSVFE